VNTPLTTVSTEALELYQRLEVAVGKLLDARLGSEEWVEAYAEVESAYYELEV
jgi:hypothetical protein